MGLTMRIPSTVGVPASTSSMTSLRRSPAAAWNESAGVLSSLGVTPAVPPPWTGVRSRIVSEPEKMVMRLPTVVLRISRMTCAGQGRYSYCHPASGFSPSWFAVIAVEKVNCGISSFLSTVRGPGLQVQGHRGLGNRRRQVHRSTANRRATRDFPRCTYACEQSPHRNLCAACPLRNFSLQQLYQPSSSSSSSSHSQQSAQRPHSGHKNSRSDSHSGHSLGTLLSTFETREFLVLVGRTELHHAACDFLEAVCSPDRATQSAVVRVAAHVEKLNGVRRVENYVVLKDDPIRNGFGMTSQR